MVAVAASCFTGCEGKITSSGEINITGNGEKSSSVEELSSAEDESASTGGSTSDQEITLESLQQANLLSNLFSQYDSVVYTEDYPCLLYTSFSEYSSKNAKKAKLERLLVKKGTPLQNSKIRRDIRKAFERILIPLGNACLLYTSRCV